VKGKLSGILLVALLIINGQPVDALAAANWSFSIDSLGKMELHYTYPGTTPLNVNSLLTLPLKTVYLHSDYLFSEDDFIVADSDMIAIGTISPDLPRFDNKITSLDSTYKTARRQYREHLDNFVYDIQKIKGGNSPYQAITFQPVIIDSNGTLFFIREISLKSYMAVSEIDINTIPENMLNQTREKASPRKISSVDGLPLGIPYVIVTSPALAPAFRKLADFHTACGIPSQIALIDSIYAYYPGCDNAERLRNYLLEYYAGGGQYLVLGGDDEILPIRYLCYYNTSTPPNPKDIFLSDLYFADMTGDWDTDGDNIWGEPTDDAPDIIPELSVGRIPVKTTEAAEKYIAKLIAYCTNPGCGDYSYLSRSLFFSSDEMRDYPAIGQHGVIAQGFPSYFAIDTSNTIEIPSGGASSPTNLNGLSSISRLSEGYGIVNIIAHGRADGFLVKSANYGDWPASLIITGTAVSGHGSVMDIAPNGKSSLYYSLSCDVGGYDLDSIDGESRDLSLVERLITLDSCGAVAMVANSRWGWVYSSYLLQQSFMENLFGAAEGNPVRAMQLSWLKYPFLRDLIYGQTYFGDPALTIYRTAPQTLTMGINYNGADSYQITAYNGETAAPGAEVNIALDSQIIFMGVTDQNGHCFIDIALDYDAEYSVAIIKDNHTIAYKKFIPSISLGVDDDPRNLPGKFCLSQNFPNPFNPTTTIGYSLPTRADVTLTIYNILGQTIKTFDIKEQAAGDYSIEWDGTDNAAQELASGIYFYRLTAENFTETKKMVLLR
jgi:hypothetical protein